MYEMGKRLFKALYEAARGELGAAHVCTEALKRASARGACAADIEAARTAMDELAPELGETLLARSHFALRTDLSPYGLQPDSSIPQGKTLS